MKTAWLELRRHPSRFSAATAILTLIAILLMFLGGLLDGLIKNATGAVSAIDADAIIFSESAHSSFLRSRIEPGTSTAIRDHLDSQVGGLGVVLLGVRIPHRGPRDLTSVAVWGYEISPTGVPKPAGPGRAWADRSLKTNGLEVGDELLVGSERTPLTIAGWVDNTSYNGQASLWTDIGTWRGILNKNRPDAALANGVFQALTVSGPDSLTEREVLNTLTRALGEGYTALTVSETRDAIPGVTEQQATFNQILGVTLVIALLVIALFFALVTVERTGLYAVFKAVGASSRYIFAGLIVQATLVTAIAATLATVTVLVLNASIPAGSIPLFISPQRIVSSTASLLFAAVVGCTFSLRRVLRIDPATALGDSL